jgi:FAD:protein FMN transferase
MPPAALAARHRTETRFRAMGTDVHVTALGGPAGLVDQAAPSVEALEARWSRFRNTSELCRLNDATGRPVLVSPDTFDLIQCAIEAWRITDGRYDPTVLHALIALGYDRDFASVEPDRSEAAPSPAPVPGCLGIELDPLVNSVLLPDGVALDLGGIGKGRAADLLAAKLLDAGAAGACVNLGGDLRVAGEPPSPQGWMVEIDDPFETGDAGSVALLHGAVATSTRLRRAWSRDGRPLHHLVDPATGAPAESGLASVTVLAGEAWWAEVLAKAAFVAGPEAGVRLLADQGVTGLLLHDDGHFEALPGLEAFRP